MSELIIEFIPGENNESSYDNSSINLPPGSDYGLSVRVLATILHVSIFIFGVTGNILLIIVARRTKSLQTPTYSYLTSLAFADLLVLFAAVPEAIVFIHIGKRWLAGPVGCSLFVFVNFLGFNTGSVSILAFTMERYIAIVTIPMVQNFCTVERTKKIIIGIWITMIIYCSPWLALMEVKADPEFSDRELCDFRFSSQVNMYLFGSDFTLFYLLPLTVAIFVYSRIWLVLCKSSRYFAADGDSSGTFRVPSYRTESSRIRSDAARSKDSLSMRRKGKIMHSTSIIQSRVQVLPMLMVTVCFFAIAWLPFRGLLIYNAIVSEPWLDMGYLLFARTLIYLNSAINPFLYNVMSRRFRAAVSRILTCNSRGKRYQNPRNEFPLGTIYYRRPPFVTTLSNNGSFPL